MRLIYFICATFLLMSVEPLSAKVRILTFHYNEPAFIELQYKTLSTFLKDDYELIVFNDADTPHREKIIKQACKKYGIKCIRYKQEWHKDHPLNEQIFKQIHDPTFVHSHIGIDKNFFKENICKQPSIRHCHVIQYALDNFGYDHNDIVVLLDGDAFPIREMSIRELLKDTPITGIDRNCFMDNVSYLWVPFIAMDMPNLPNKRDLQFHADVIEKKLYDTGANSYYYLQNNPFVPCKMHIGTASCGLSHWDIPDIINFGMSETEALFIKALPSELMVEFHMNNSILHYAGSSFELAGWKTKLTYVTEFVNKIVKEEKKQKNRLALEGSF